jgi:hypothetical protein
MDARKKRLSFVLGFGVLALALVAVFSVWPPAVNQDDATGAIGAVKKHRQTQIASEDVILGDEGTRHEQKVLYSDYFKDAQTLQNIAADLASDMDMAARADIQARADLAAKSLDAHYADLQSRYIANMDRALEAAKNLAARDADLAARVNTELQAMGAQLHAKQELGVMDMEQLNASLAAINRDLAAKNLGSFSLDNIERDLAAQVRDLQSRANLGNEAMLEAAKNIGNLSRDLSARADVANRVNLGNDVDYLGALTLEAKSVLDAKNSLGKAATLGNFDNLGMVADNLASEAFTLESRAIDNLESRFAADAETASRISNMEAMLASAKSLGVKGEAAEALNAFNAELQSRNADFQNRVSLGIEAELAAINRHMDARANIEARSNIGSRSNLGAKTLDAKSLDAKNLGAKNLDAKANLGSKNLDAKANLGAKNLGAKANLGSMDRDQFGSRVVAHLGAINRSLDAKNNLGGRIANREQLASTARNLEAKANLGAKADLAAKADRQ